MPLNAATPNSRLALARNPTVTGSSALRSNLKVISPPTPRAPADAPSSRRFSFAQQTHDARTQPPFDTEKSPKLSPHASAIGIYELVNIATCAGPRPVVNLQKIEFAEVKYICRAHLFHVDD
jgi:hypothetical protein